MRAATCTRPTAYPKFDGATDDNTIAHGFEGTRLKIRIAAAQFDEFTFLIRLSAEWQGVGWSSHKIAQEMGMGTVHRAAHSGSAALDTSRSQNEGAGLSAAAGWGVGASRRRIERTIGHERNTCQMDCQSP